MLDNAFLVTSRIIETNEIASFVRNFGGSVYPHLPGYGWIPRGDWRVRVTYGPECDSAILADAIGDNEKVVEEKLAAIPCGCVNLEINRVPGSEIAAIDFSVAFAKQWPSVVIDIDGHVLDLADLQRLQREGKGFGSDSVPTDQS